MGVKMDVFLKQMEASGFPVPITKVRALAAATTYRPRPAPLTGRRRTNHQFLLNLLFSSYRTCILLCSS